MANSTRSSSSPAFGPGIFLAAALCMAAVSAPARAAGEEPQNVITFDLMGGFKGMGQVEYQRLIWDDYAWKLRAMFWSLTADKWLVAANGGGVGFRKYTQGTAPEGGYMEMSLDLAQFSADSIKFGPAGVQNSFYVIPGASLGYSWFHEGSFFAELTFGAKNMMGGIKPVVGKNFAFDGLYYYFTISFGLPF